MMAVDQPVASARRLATHASIVRSNPQGTFIYTDIVLCTSLFAHLGHVQERFRAVRSAKRYP